MITALCAVFIFIEVIYARPNGVYRGHAPTLAQ